MSSKSASHVFPEGARRKQNDAVTMPPRIDQPLLKSAIFHQLRMCEIFKEKLRKIDTCREELPKIDRRDETNLFLSGMLGKILISSRPIQLSSPISKTENRAISTSQNLEKSK